jgi:uncharacterized protein
MAGWTRWLTSCALLLIAVAVAVGAAAGKLHLPGWAEALAAAAAAVAGLFTAPLKKRVTNWLERPDQQHAVLLSQTRLHNRRGRIQRVRDCDQPTDLGVHRPAQYAAADGRPAEAGVPPYVVRDADASETLAAGLRDGGLVIIVGASSAGKTRMAYEAVRRHAGNRLLIVPGSESSLRELTKAGIRLANAIVWLDDINDYIAARGLDAAIIDALCPQGRQDVLLLGTVRTEAMRELQAASDDSPVRRAFRDVERRARFIALSRVLTEAERERAEQLRGADSRIGAALDQLAGAGFAEYLAAAPAILRRWEAPDDPVGGAIVSAAVDARRAGFISPLPRDLLEQLHTLYLDPREARQSADADRFSEALGWAVRPVEGASACLIDLGAGTYQPFDYLLDHAQAADAAPVPDGAWPVLLAGAAQADLLPIGFAALRARRLVISASAFRQAASNGEPAAMYGLANVYYVAGDDREAQEWTRVAADSGEPRAMHNLGVQASKAGDQQAAEDWYRRAAEAGETSAMNNLANMLNDSGRTQEAERWYRKAAAAGDNNYAMYGLGALLEQTHRTQEAERWYRKAAEAGDVSAQNGLGRLLQCTGGKAEMQEAGTWYRKAADAGNITALGNLGTLYEDLGQPREAETWYRKGARAGEPGAMMNLGGFLQRTGRAAEALSWHQAAAAAGDRRAMLNLGVVLMQAGDAGQAEEWFRKAASAGLPQGSYNLGVLLSEASRTDEAKRSFMDAAEAGHAGAMLNLGFMLEQAGDADQAERWYRQAGTADLAAAVYNLGVLLDKQGRDGEATESFRQAAGAGDANAMFALGLRLDQADQRAEAEQWYRRAAEAGNAGAMCNLGALYVKRRRLRAAHGWYERAAEAGDATAMYWLGAISQRLHRAKDAQKWYRQAAAAGHQDAARALAAAGMEPRGRAGPRNGRRGRDPLAEDQAVR